MPRAWADSVAHPVQALRRWAGGSVLNRMTAISTGTSFVLLAVMAAVAFPLFYAQTRANERADLRNQLERAHDELGLRLGAVLDSLSQLASNSFVVNAFVDSTGRELYLLPTLRDYRPPLQLALALTLYDSNLAVFADTRPGRAHGTAVRDAVRQSLQDGRRRLLFDAGDGASWPLRVALPVYYPPASSHEGVLLAELDLQPLVTAAAHALDDDACLSVSHGNALLWSRHCDARTLADAVARPLDLGPAGAGEGALVISYGLRVSRAEGRLAWLTATYTALSLGALVIAFVATRTIGRPFAAKLEELAQTAHALAVDPSSPARARWEQPDEIGRLTVAFDALVDQWRDIRASLEERVRQRTGQLSDALEQARESSRAKSEFLAVMSHEIRTPMNGVLGMLQVLEASELSEAQRRHLQVMRGSSTLLLRLIDDMLDLSRIEAGKLALEPARLQVDALLRELLTALAPTARAAGVTLTLELATAALAEPVLGDPTRLRQVFSNLLHNAIKFTAPGGQVRLAATAAPHGDALRLVCSVEDNGVGIEPAQLQRIFEPFEQGDHSPTRRFGGAGLGLAIVKRLLGLMRGEIAVESRPGVGSRFTVTLALPRAGAAVAGDAAAGPQDPAALAGLRVLVVEDNETNQIVEQAMLHSLGVERVTLATNGREAVEIGARESFDLILMDCFMPVMDGYQATRALRRAGVATPIVAMTANVMPEQVAAAFEAGMVDCIAKPMDRDELRRLIERRAFGGSHPVAVEG